MSEKPSLAGQLLLGVAHHQYLRLSSFLVRHWQVLW